MDILGVQETRREEQEVDRGDQNLILTDSWPSTAKARQRRVVTAVKKRFAGSVIEQATVSERVAYVKFAAQSQGNLVVLRVTRSNLN